MDESTYEQIKQLVAVGKGRRSIAIALGITEDAARYWITKIKATDCPESNKREQIESLLNQGATTVEVARAIHAPINTTNNWTNKIAGTFEPVDKQIKLELSKGTSLFKMQNKFSVKDIQEIRTLIADLFDNVLVYEKDLPDGDISILLIPDRTNEFDWLKGLTRQASKFKYYVSPANNYMFVQFDDDLPDEIKVFNFTDLHIGSKFCRTELLKHHIKMVAEDPAAFTFLGGDIFDYMHKNSVGQPWEQKLSPMQQVSTSARMLMPLAHKNIRYCSGNHDRGRGYNLVGADLAESLANLLQTSYGYMETVIDFSFKGHIFTAILHHGRGSGNTIQTILNETEGYKKSATFFVNWKLSGHVHQSFIVPRNVTRKVDGVGLSVQRSYTVVGGSYMERTGSYAEETKYMPTPQDLTYITMRADGSYDAGAVKIDSI